MLFRSALNNAELLAVILRTGSVGENSLELASRLLAIESLSGLVSMTVAQLTKIRGIGKVKAIQLQCIVSCQGVLVRQDSRGLCWTVLRQSETII